MSHQKSHMELCGGCKDGREQDYRTMCRRTFFFLLQAKFPIPLPPPHAQPLPLYICSDFSFCKSLNKRVWLIDFSILFPWCQGFTMSSSSSSRQNFQFPLDFLHFIPDFCLHIWAVFIVSEVSFPWGEGSFMPDFCLHRRAFSIVSEVSLLWGELPSGKLFKPLLVFSGLLHICLCIGPDL
jgi:hypothetical protein